MRKAYLRLNTDFVMAALHLPGDVVCHGASFNKSTGELLLHIEHPTLRNLADDVTPPRVVAVMEQGWEKVEFRHFMETP